ncbi:MAG: AbrB/MazE/SpoVT family DNA-binding domain-containing protein [Chloroflexi bacterium]|nr:MAG: AbrB/MazE/SpoVT family DNA-binding domain-containing protein [Chloroflexota bacterium]
MYDFPIVRKSDLGESTVSNSLAVLRRKNQLTLPAEVARAAHLEEGDPVEVRLVKGGILLRPKKLVDAEQAWFWTSKWQDGERRASADIAKGRVERFESDKDFLESFDE